MATHKDNVFQDGDLSEWQYFNIRNHPFPVMEFIPWPLKVAGLIFQDGSEMWTAGGGGGAGVSFLAGPGISLTPGLGTLTITNTQMQSPWLGNVNANNYGITNLATINGMPVTNLLPGGTNGQIQINNNGAFGGLSALTWDNTNQRLGIGTNANTATVLVGNPAQAGTMYLIATGGPNMGLVDLVSNASWNGSAWTQNDPLVSSWDVGFRDSTATEVSFPSLWSVRFMAAGEPPGLFPTTRLAITRGGNVGIGTDGPAFKLDVQGGDINCTGQYRINGVPISFAGGAYVNDNPPASPAVGDFWFDATGLKLYIRFSGTWVGI